ncbi:MAG: acetate--CoA ligase family protein, partial [Chloroflexi bacterium]|nr:acetate--CoA ligase family protein [Chloroflexota bacterium]
MKTHEYQAKAMMAKFGIPVPRGEVVSSPEEAAAATARLGGKAVLKSQVYAGGRGKAGGIQTA